MVTDTAQNVTLAGKIGGVTNPPGFVHGMDHWPIFSEFSFALHICYFQLHAHSHIFVSSHFRSLCFDVISICQTSIPLRMKLSWLLPLENSKSNKDPEIDVQGLLSYTYTYLCYTVLISPCTAIRSWRNLCLQWCICQLQHAQHYKHLPIYPT